MRGCPATNPRPSLISAPREFLLLRGKPLLTVTGASQEDGGQQVTQGFANEQQGRRQHHQEGTAGGRSADPGKLGRCLQLGVGLPHLPGATSNGTKLW